MIKPIAVIFIASALTACAVAPAPAGKEPRTSSPLQGVSEIGENSLNRVLKSSGVLHFKGRHLPAAEQTSKGRHLPTANQAISIGFFSVNSTGAIYTLRLGSEHSCATGYGLAAEYVQHASTLDTTYWPAGTIASCQVDLTITWDGNEVVVSVADTQKMFRLKHRVSSVTIEVGGGKFLVDERGNP